MLADSFRYMHVTNRKLVQHLLHRLCIVVGDDVWMMLGARQVAVGDLHRNTKLGNGIQASREKKQLPHSTLKTFAALLDLTQVVVRADPCEGSLVREPLFKEDTQRNFPISFGRLASTGGCIDIF